MFICPTVHLCELLNWALLDLPFIEYMLSLAEFYGDVVQQIWWFYYFCW